MSRYLELKTIKAQPNPVGLLVKFSVTRTTTFDDLLCDEAVRVDLPNGGFDYRIEMSSIADLTSFVEKYGKIIVDKEGDDYFTIEIYDGWRE